MIHICKCGRTLCTETFCLTIYCPCGMVHEFRSGQHIKSYKRDGRSVWRRIAGLPKGGDR